jgi:hypothetical protein
MNAVAASRLRMMLAAGKRRLENKEARSKEERRCRRAEGVLERYRKEHGPLTYDSPPAVLDLARLVAHHRAKLNDPKYRAFIETREVPLPDPAPAPKADKPKRNQAYFEELRTKQAEARAADPEKFERERRAQRVASNQYWDHIRFERAHSNAAEEIAEVLPKDRKERYRDIWQVITQSILAHRWLIVNAGQVQLYHLRKKQPRVRGVGRAARLAGF